VREHGWGMRHTLRLATTRRERAQQSERGRWSRRAHRWNHWARALITRHELVALRPAALSMIFMRPMPQYGWVHERWLRSSHQFFPQVHLAIQPLLRSTVWLEHHRHTETQSHFTRQTLISPQAQLQRMSSFLQTGRPSAKLAAEPSGSVGSPVMQHMSFTHAAAAITAQAAGQAPRLSVLQRLQRTDELTRWHRRSHLTAERVLTIVRQVVRQTTRVEEGVRGHTALITRQMQTIVPRATSTPGAPEHAVASLPVVNSAPTHPPMPNPMPMPGVNLEQLTDQVMRQMDRRVIAWRERRGRI
jgi:hypothetical protein